MKNFTQKQRVFIWLLYLLSLIILSYWLFSKPIPPTAEKGIWFYSCLASIILGDLITNPYFTSPADALSNTTAAIVSLFAVNPLSINQNKPNLILWASVLSFNLIILFLSIGQILSKDSGEPKINTLSQLLYKITSFLGNHRIIFSIVVIFALFSFHLDNSIELFSIGLTSVLIITVHPIEKIWSFINKISSSISLKPPKDIGEIVGYEYPNVLRIKSQSGSILKFGDLVAFRGDRGENGIGCILDQIGFTGDIWYRILTFQHHHRFNNKLVKTFGKRPEQIVYKVDDDHLGNNDIEEYVHKVNQRLIGIVAPNSDINKIIVELVRTDIDLKEGRLVETEIGSDTVLYQVINGLTREEIIEQKNNRGYVHAEARKLGTWKNDTLKSVGWVPLPNTPVFIFDIKNPEFKIESIGFLPGTNFDVSIDINSLVTHNAAILGILGIGKTCLALELIERMIKNKIKVICLDITDEYEKQLEPYINEESLTCDLAQLTNIRHSGKENYSNIKQEGGNICEFEDKLRKILYDFLVDGNNNERLKIFNPAIFQVWQQTGGIFRNIAPMATLTHCEITRIFSEVTLDILQKQGLTDTARCCIVYEEAHSLVPEWSSVAYEGDKAATNGSAKAILQGRKYGLGCLLITQRTANVTKSILNQCNTVFALRTLDSTGISYLKDFVGEDYASVLTTLEDRHSIVFGKASSSNMPVIIHLNDRAEFLNNFRAEFQEFNDNVDINSDLENNNDNEDDDYFSVDDTIPF